MLNLVRKHANSWLIKTLLWLLVVAFVGTIFYSWGMGGRYDGRSGVLGTVNGININLSEYDQSYNNLVNFYRDQFQSQFSEEMIEKLDLKNSALDALITKKLLLLEAEKQNIQVSDDETPDSLAGKKFGDVRPAPQAGSRRDTFINPDIQPFPDARLLHQ